MKIILNDSLEGFYVSDKIFNVKFKKILVHQVFTSYLSNIRQNSKLNKNRAVVSGSGRKPWKQKGTGKARAGSTRSPLWRSGGVTFGNQIKSYKKKINKKMYKEASKSVLSLYLKFKKIIIFKKFLLNSINTKFLYNRIKFLCNNKKTLILLLEKNINLEKSSSNIFFLNLKYIKNFNLINILNYKFIILTIDVIKYIENILN